MKHKQHFRSALKQKKFSSRQTAFALKSLSKTWTTDSFRTLQHDCRKVRRWPLNSLTVQSRSWHRTVHTESKQVVLTMSSTNTENNVVQTVDALLKKCEFLSIRFMFSQQSRRSNMQSKTMFNLFISRIFDWRLLNIPSWTNLWNFDLLIETKTFWFTVRMCESMESLEREFQTSFAVSGLLQVLFCRIRFFQTVMNESEKCQKSESPLIRFRQYQNFGNPFEINSQLMNGMNRIHSNSLSI